MNLIVVCNTVTMMNEPHRGVQYNHSEAQLCVQYYHNEPQRGVQYCHNEPQRGVQYCHNEPQLYCHILPQPDLVSLPGPQDDTSQSPLSPAGFPL